MSDRWTIPGIDDTPEEPNFGGANDRLNFGGQSGGLNFNGGDAPRFTPPAARDPANRWTIPGATAAPTTPSTAPLNFGGSGNPALAGMNTGTQWSSRTVRWFERGSRFVSSVLSPLMGAQDILFASTEALLDPNVGFWENWKKLDWASYTPWTPASTRPASGADLARAAGIKGESAQRIVGLIADLTLDPLAFGSLLRGTARVAGMAGRLDRLADAADTAAEATLLLGAVPTTRVARAARAAVPTVVRTHIDRNLADAGEILGRFLNTTIREADIGSGMRDITIGNAFLPEGSRLEGAYDLISQTRGVAREAAQDVNERIAQMLSAVGDKRAGRWIQDIVNGQSLHRDIPRNIGNYDPEVSNILLRSIYDTARQTGAHLVTDASNLDDAARGIRGAPGEFFGEVGDIIRNAGPGAPPALYQMPRQSADLLVREADRLREIAAKRGLDPDELIGNWRYGLQKVAEADAITGYHTSGMGLLREVFWEQLGVRGLGPNQIREAWTTYLREGMAGRAGAWRQSRIAPGLRGKDVFGRYGEAFALNADALLANIPQGHMRRSFGMFLSPEQFTRYEKALEDGLLTPARILDEPAGLTRRDARRLARRQAVAAGRGAPVPPTPATVLEKLRARNPRLTGILEQYVAEMTPSGTSGAAGRAQGATMPINTLDLQEAMVRRGVDPTDASNYIREMVQEMNPQLVELAGTVQLYRKSRIGDVRGLQPAIGGRAAFGERQMLDLDELDVLLELADPAVSMAETARAATTAISSRNSIAELLRLGQKSGLIRSISAHAADGWKAVTTDVGQRMPLLAPFAGQELHPMLYREVMNLAAMSQRPNEAWRAYQQIRGMITGGFLANPATTTTNIAGGFLTSWLQGLPLGQMVRNYRGVLRDLKTQGRNLPEYREIGDLIEGALTNQDFIRNLPRMKSDLLPATSTRERLAELGQTMYDAYQNNVLRPRGAAKFLGLRYFEASEAVMRLAAYRTALEMGKTVKDARRTARFVVFDYASQPRVVEAAKNLGVLAFPAFPYFMMGRTVNALLNRPARLAAIERAPGAIWEAAIPDEDERMAALAALDDWMVSGKYIPIRDQGNGLRTFFPFGQFLPTDTIGKDGFMDSLSSIGLLGPLIDLVVATVTPDSTGEAPITGRFGRRVFQETATGPERFRQTLQFLYNSFAPGWARKAFRFSETGMAGPTGLIPTGIDFARNGFSLRGEGADAVATTAEVLRRRPDRDFLDEVVGFTLRSVRPVNTGPGATSGSVRKVEGAYYQLQSVTTQLAKEAAAVGTQAALTRAQIRIGEEVERFEELYGPITEVIQQLPRIFPGANR